MSDSVRPHRRQPTRLGHPWDSPGKNTVVGCHFLLQCMKVKGESEVAQSCLTLSDPMDCSLPGSSVHGIFQARVLEWGAIAFSKLASVWVNKSQNTLQKSVFWWFKIFGVTYALKFSGSYSPSVWQLNKILAEIFRFSRSLETHPWYSFSKAPQT